MANTFELIASSTVGAGGVSSISFSSIPGTYTDLCLKYSLRQSDASIGQVTTVKFNTLTTNQSGKYLSGDGASASSASATFALFTPANGATSNTFGNGEIYIPNYAGSTNKSVSMDSVTENNAATAYNTLTALLWSSTAAITQFDIVANGASTFVQYSTAYLYGVKNA